MSDIIEPPLIEPFDPAANRAETQPRPARPRNEGPGIKARLKLVLDRLSDIFGDEDFADALRDDLNYSGLGLEPGTALPELDSDIFTSFSDGIDPDLDSLKSSLGDIVQLIDDVKEMIEAAAKADEDPRYYWDVIYYCIKVSTLNAARTDSPFIYAVARLLTFISENAESWEAFDPARFMAVLRGEGNDAATGAQSTSQKRMDQAASAIALGAGITRIVWDQALAETLRGKLTFDYYFGWELIADDTAVADRIAARTLTVVLGAAPVADAAATPPLLASADGEPATAEADESAAPFRVSATLVLVDDVHGGPGFLISFGGDAGFVHAGEDFELEARIGAAGGAAQFVSLSDTQPSRPITGSLSPFGKLAFMVRPSKEDAEDPPVGTRIDFKKFGLSAETADGVAAIILSLEDASLVIDAADMGRLLRAVIGDSSRIDFGVRILWDTVRGLCIDGGSGLRVVRTVEKPLLPGLQIQQLTLAVAASPDEAGLARLEVSAALASKIGGWAVTVERMGLTADFGYDETRNGGPLVYVPRFKAPSGIGLQLRLANMDGGGYLYLDQDAGEYAGALQLQWRKFALKAIAAYRDGETQNSFIAFLFGEFPPVTLLPCVYLTGVGGMFGINHSISVEALEAGLRGGVLDDLMFPSNPVADAPRILNRIRTIFPSNDQSNDRRMVAMIMARFAGSTPDSPEFKIAYLVERVLGSGVAKRIIMLQLAMRRPMSDPRLQIIIDGVIHFNPQEGSGGFTGRLRDSRIGKARPIAISGMAVGRWDMAREGGQRRNWLISIGGFHPAFTEVPAGLPVPIDRIGAQFAAGPAEFLLELYCAFGTATLQFGLSAFVQIRSGSINLLGRAAFDTLINRDTNRWDAVGFGSFVLRYKDEDLCGIELSYRWAGPDPSELGGKCTLNLLGWKQDFNFAVTWGDDVAIPNQFSDSLEIMRAELANPANWEAALPRGVPSVLSFATAPDGTPFAAHPLGCLQFSQTRIPFDLDLQRIGSSRVSGPTRFALESARLGKSPAMARPQLIDDYFALSEYRNLSESDKLARPQLERLVSGCRFGEVGYRVGTAAPDQALSCETLYLDPEAATDHPKPPIAMRERSIARPDLATLTGHARLGGVGQVPVRRNHRLTPAVAQRFRVKAPPLAAAGAGHSPRRVEAWELT